MGANARKRREKKEPASESSFQVMAAALSNSEFNRLARPSCSECGFGGIVWSTLGELATGPEPLASEARDLLPLAGASADAWMCPKCGGFGAFEQTMHGSF